MQLSLYNCINLALRGNFQVRPNTTKHREPLGIVTLTRSWTINKALKNIVCFCESSLSFLRLKKGVSSLRPIYTKLNKGQKISSSVVHWSVFCLVVNTWSKMFMSPFPSLKCSRVEQRIPLHEEPPCIPYRNTAFVLILVWPLTMQWDSGNCNWTAIS